MNNVTAKKYLISYQFQQNSKISIDVSKDEAINLYRILSDKKFKNIVRSNSVKDLLRAFTLNLKSVFNSLSADKLGIISENYNVRNKLAIILENNNHSNMIHISTYTDRVKNIIQVLEKIIKEDASFSNQNKKYPIDVKVEENIPKQPLVNLEKQYFHNNNQILNNKIQLTKSFTNSEVYIGSSFNLDILIDEILNKDNQAKNLVLNLDNNYNDSTDFFIKYKNFVTIYRHKSGNGDRKLNIFYYNNFKLVPILKISISVYLDPLLHVSRFLPADIYDQIDSYLQLATSFSLDRKLYNQMQVHEIVSNDISRNMNEMYNQLNSAENVQSYKNKLFKLLNNYVAENYVSIEDTFSKQHKDLLIELATHLVIGLDKDEAYTLINQYVTSKKIIDVKDFIENIRNSKILGYKNNDIVILENRPFYIDYNEYKLKFDKQETSMDLEYQINNKRILQNAFYGYIKKYGIID